jgi:hypothetical protein
MRFLLTSAGITNTSIDNALVDLLASDMDRRGSASIGPSPSHRARDRARAAVVNRACVASPAAAFRNDA